ncbi:MAG: hypothetical protein V1754_07655, partial [Pseudomonadota bacterium]
RKVVDDPATGSEKTTREFVIRPEEEAELKELESQALYGDWNSVNSAYVAFMAKLQKRADDSSDSREKAGLTNYLSCMDDCSKSTSSTCRGLAKVQIKMCSDYRVNDKNRCEAVGRVQAAMRCVTLPCIDAKEDGRVQRIFQDSSGSPNPFEPWPD